MLEHYRTEVWEEASGQSQFTDNKLTKEQAKAKIQKLLLQERYDELKMANPVFINQNTGNKLAYEKRLTELQNQIKEME